MSLKPWILSHSDILTIQTAPQAFPVRSAALLPVASVLAAAGSTQNGRF